MFSKKVSQMKSKIAIYWYGLSNFMMKMNSFIISVLIYYLVLFPISFFRKITNNSLDLQIKSWNLNKESAFKSNKPSIKKEEFERLF